MQVPFLMSVLLWSSAVFVYHLKSSGKTPKIMVVFALHPGNDFIIQLCDPICNIWPSYHQAWIAHLFRGKEVQCCKAIHSKFSL